MGLKKVCRSWKGLKQARCFPLISVFHEKSSQEDRKKLQGYPLLSCPSGLHHQWGKFHEGREGPIELRDRSESKGGIKSIL